MKDDSLTYTLSKEERLHSKVEIDFLFSKGKKYTVFPLTLIYTKSLNEAEIKVIFLASKRSFPKAHQRNKAKRTLREVYRLNKHLVPANTFIGLSLLNKKYTFSELEKCFINAINHIQKC